MSFLRVPLFTLITFYLLLHLGFCKAYQNCWVALIKTMTVYVTSKDIPSRGKIYKKASVTKQGEVTVTIEAEACNFAMSWLRNDNVLPITSFIFSFNMKNVVTKCSDVQEVTVLFLVSTLPKSEKWAAVTVFLFPFPSYKETENLSLAACVFKISSHIIAILS